MKTAAALLAYMCDVVASYSAERLNEVSDTKRYKCTNKPNEWMNEFTNADTNGRTKFTANKWFVYDFPSDSDQKSLNSIASWTRLMLLLLSLMQSQHKGKRTVFGEYTHMYGWRSETTNIHNGTYVVANCMACIHICDMCVEPSAFRRQITNAVFWNRHAYSVAEFTPTVEHLHCSELSRSHAHSLTVCPDNSHDKN